jgi:hypothetical protein
MNVEKTYNCLDPAISFESRKIELDKQEERRQKRKRKQKIKNYKSWCHVVLDEKSLNIFQDSLSKLLYYFLIKSDKHLCIKDIDYEKIQEDLGLSKEVITETINYMKDNNIIKVTKDGKQNIYQISESVMWKSKLENKENANK